MRLCRNHPHTFSTTTCSVTRRTCPKQPPLLDCIVLYSNMQNETTRDKPRRLFPLRKGKKTPPSPTPSAVPNKYDDGQLAQNRYSEAANNLKKAIETRKGSWDSFDFDGLSCEPEGHDDSKLKDKISDVFLSRQASIKDRKGWAKLTYAVECVFTAFSPFAKNFVTIAGSAQSVIPFSIRLPNYCIDTHTESVWLNLPRSLCFNNRFCTRKYQCSDYRLLIRRLQEMRASQKPWITFVNNLSSLLSSTYSLRILNDAML